jgi:hypothetical protein
MSHQKALNTLSNNHCYDKVPLSYILDKGKFKDYLPGIVALYPGKLLKQYHKRRSHKRQSGAPSPESVVKEEHHKGSGITNKE